MCSQVTTLAAAHKFGQINYFSSFLIYPLLNFEGLVFMFYYCIKEHKSAEWSEDKDSRVRQNRI